MKLLNDLIIRRLDLVKDFDLNNENFKSIWNFYQCYKIAINFLGYQDRDIRKKDLMILKLIQNPNSMKILSNLKNYIDKDNIQIELFFNNFKESEEEDFIYEDFYPSNIMGINLDER